MHLLAGVANGWRVEFHVLMWHAGEAIFRDAPRPEGGRVTLSERPALRRFAGCRDGDTNPTPISSGRRGDARRPPPSGG
jgi:hypothetical protein